MRLLLCTFVIASSLPIAGMAQDKRSPPTAVEPSLSVLPVAVDHTDARSAASLRDSLRQPIDDGREQPYRLSPEARQLMREQLRKQAAARELPKN